MASVLMKIDDGAEREKWLMVKAINTMLAGGMEWVEIEIATEMMYYGAINKKDLSVAVMQDYIVIEDIHIHRDGRVWREEV